MEKLAIADLWKLEDYAARRSEFRRQVLKHKKLRTIHLGSHVTLLFEDRVTVQYQVQEMLRIERLFERAAIQNELDAYNPLIPDGGNWKATCLIEYEDPAERAQQLVALRGLESSIWVKVGSGALIHAIADEDLDRQTPEKTSAVHFLRFELDNGSRSAVKSGAAISFGITHPAYSVSAPVPEPVRAALVADID